MSYEGVNYHICKSGHVYSIDAVEDDYDDGERCVVCGEPFVGRICLDMTNGLDDDTYPDGFSEYFEQISPTKIEICDCCHGEKVVEEARWKIVQAKPGAKCFTIMKETIPTEYVQRRQNG